ncbi:hypothetical protein Ancab_023774 [Ancistrocladus abbreviatus]
MAGGFYANLTTTISFRNKDLRRGAWSSDTPLIMELWNELSNSRSRDVALIAP